MILKPICPKTLFSIFVKNSYLICYLLLINTILVPCVAPLGMESRRIRNHQLNGYSVRTSAGSMYWAGSCGRLNNAAAGLRGDSFMPLFNSGTDVTWLMVLLFVLVETVEREISNTLLK